MTTSPKSYHRTSSSSFWNHHFNHHHHYQHVNVLFWYAICGALHELAHVLAGQALGVSIGGSTKSAIFDILFQRQVNLNVIDGTFGGNNNYDIISSIIRHAGWIFSLVLALSIPKKYVSARFAAFLTMVEAISTDLFQFPVLLPIFGNFQSSGSSATGMYFCGNFGVILLHHMWLSNRSKNALDCLQKMVQVTMMRGAQSGGVVLFHPNRQGGLTGVRSRVVNMKRTDLSVLVRQKVEKGLPSKVPKDFVICMAGHTRFATSSKATMDGTHPHQWTPASTRRVYNFSVPHQGGGDLPAKPKSIPVENYITHNGDFDFYTLNGKTHDVEVIQKWLVHVTGCPMPASVDSCAVAGMVDVLRTQGCFGLSARYALAVGLPTSTINDDLLNFPYYTCFEKIGCVFEDVLGEMLKTMTLDTVGNTSQNRHAFAVRVLSKLEKAHNSSLLHPIERFLSDDESGGNLMAFCIVTIDAFFDNDLFMTTQTFLKNAKGSFGLCVNSSLDAHRQVCLAARGQTMSVAFYPNKGLICYGSEQAAVKAGLDAVFPGTETDVLGRSQGDVDNDALRLDLDDLGGEIIVLDWGVKNFKNPPVSQPNRHLTQYELMNGGVTAILFQESKSAKQDPLLYHRMTRLTRNRFIKPLRPEPDDLVLADIHDIPKICQAIQDEWRSTKAATSLNRLTAFNLSRCLRDRLDAHVAGTVPPLAIDILVTGCEVSLWIGEQFAADLQKAFPRLRVKAVSSNKLLGIYGQEIAVPAVGFPYSSKTYNINDAIVIIVSHSGGTFGPLSCSNLLQSATKNIFVVTSEWDTQIGKQLRAMADLSHDDDHWFNSRIFTTDVGLRPAEPCSVSVAATHQLLTNLFEYICVVILSDTSFRQITDATITEQDIRILERCNRMNIEALTDIVGVSGTGYHFDKLPRACKELKEAGDLWAEHVLENAKAYIMTFVYIFVTVISGYPLFSAIAYAAGLEKSSDWYYLVRTLDAALYFWLPQINITILRILQGRNLLHRMVGRTVAIGDIPWVAQSAEAFLSKLFACSYSIAGVNVISGNPVDHFVHRHTHRVTRGTLLVCGRPDGRLSKLSTAEASVCLSVNQASSIQSWGGTCESITIGHNPFKLPLSHKGIFLKRKRPLFLCERMLVENDAHDEKRKSYVPKESDSSSESKEGCFSKLICRLRNRKQSILDSSLHHLDSSIKPRVNKHRSAAALFGAYVNMEEAGVNNQKSEVHQAQDEEVSVDDVIEEAIQERKWEEQAKKLFQALDLDNNGYIKPDEFVEGASKLNSSLSKEEALNFFYHADENHSGKLTYDQFLNLLRSSDFTAKVKVPPSHKNDRGIIQIEASAEKYFGENMRKLNQGTNANKDMDFLLARTQRFSQELYETRIASLQRFVAMTVMFHQMASRVERFFRKISFGLWGYRIDRTHSIMRIATTASPVSGADVRQRMRHLRLVKKVRHSVHVISVAYLAYKKRQAKKLLAERHTLTNGNTPSSS